MKLNKRKVNKSSVVFVTCRTGFVTKGLLKTGYRVVFPYYGGRWVLRVPRDCWMKARIPGRIWFKKKIVRMNPSQVIIHDPLITEEYLNWIVRALPNTSFHFVYNNLVGRAKHVMPNAIPKDFRVTTYDEGDSKKYGLELSSEQSYFPCYIGKKKEVKYDVFFVGADKGRGDYLLNLQRQIETLGLKTKFIITADSLFAKRKPYYSRRISYEKIIEYDNESRSILNIPLAGQYGATLRDFESIFNNVKLITANTNIRKYDFYKDQNVFILGERKLSELQSFLDKPFVRIDDEILKKYLLPKV